MKNELHSLYIKHDGQFKTLSKIALSQIILKIVHLKGEGSTIRYIESELSAVLSARILTKEIEDAIRVLKNNRKLNFRNGRYFIHQEYINQLAEEVNRNVILNNKILDKYFSNAESEKSEIENGLSTS